MKQSVVLTLKFKLYDQNNNKYLNRQIDTAAEIWNHCIALHRRYYRYYKKHLNLYQLQKHITKLKKTSRYTHWSQLGSQAIQDVAVRIDKAYKAFFQWVRTRKGPRKSPPRFRKRTRYSSYTLKQTGYRFHDGNRVCICGREFKYWASRPIDGKIKTLTVKRTALGEFFICVTVAQEISVPDTRTGDAVGIDFGLKHFLTLSDGQIIDSPLWYRNTLPELRKAHRKLSKCQKGSNHRKQALLALDRVYEKISNQRTDWFFKLSYQLCNQFAVICLEDLNLDGMKRLWGRKVSDLSFYEFVEILEWVAFKTGTQVIKIGRWTPSTKPCHVCGYINRHLSLNDREWTCPNCGAHHDRDINAAVNIRKEGLKLL